MKQSSLFIRKQLKHTGILFLMVAAILIAAVRQTENVHAFSSSDLSITGKWTETATIEQEKETDYYKVTLPGDGKLTVTMQAWFSYVGFKLWDEDLTKQYVSRNLSGGKENQPSSDVMADMYLKAGVYYVEVFHNNSYTGYSESRTGEYRLKASFVNGNTNETEPNDKASEAIDLNKAKTVTGMMWEDDEYDYYKVTTDGTEPIKVKVTSWMNYIDSEIRDADQMPVTDAEGKEISHTVITKGSESEPVVKELEYAVPKGEYYIFLKKYDGYTGYSYTNTGIYKIALDQKESEKEETKTETVVSDTVKTGTKITYKKQRYVVLNASSVALVKAENVKKVTVPAAITINGKSYQVKQINAKAFRGAKIRIVTVGTNVKIIKAKAFYGSKAVKVILKTKLLKKTTIKNCLKGSKVKTVQVKAGAGAVNKKIRKTYKKIFVKKVVGRKVAVK